MLIFSSCAKDQSQTQNYQVKEYFAENKQEVREKVYNFLLAANRLGIVAKDSVAFLDIDPNEGVWLIEAAVNAERVGHLEETTIDSKTITFEIQNEVNSAGELKMKATDVLTKYNALLTEISANEINGKTAQLIDLRVESVDAAKTSINIDILYGKVNPDVVLPDSIPGGGPSNNKCDYNWNGLDNYPNSIDWTQNFGYPNIYPNGVFSSSPINVTGYGTDIGSFGWYFQQIIDEAFHHVGPQPTGSLGTFIDPNSDQGYTPYTNINLFNSSQLEIQLGCRNFEGDGPIVPDVDIFVDMYHQMAYSLESTLPQSNYREYSPIHSIFELTGSSKGKKFMISSMAFVYTNSY